MNESLTAERVARNDATFRAANEHLARVATRQERSSDEPLPFLCECADPACTRVIKVTLAEYHRVRSEPRCFVVAPGHDAGEADAVQVVEAHDGYDVTEKTGHAGEIVERLADEGGPE